MWQSRWQCFFPSNLFPFQMFSVLPQKCKWACDFWVCACFWSRLYLERCCCSVTIWRPPINLFLLLLCAWLPRVGPSLHTQMLFALQLRDYYCGSALVSLQGRGVNTMSLLLVLPVIIPRKIFQKYFTSVHFCFYCCCLKIVFFCLQRWYFSLALNCTLFI